MRRKIIENTLVLNIHAVSHLQLPQQPQRIDQLVRPVYWLVLKYHEITELPSSLFLPSIAQLQLADGI